MASPAQGGLHRGTHGDTGGRGGRQGGVLGRVGRRSGRQATQDRDPEYAYHREGGKRTPVIVVQAEEAQGLQLVGVRLPNGKGLVLPLKSVQLLGKTPPGK